MARGQGKGQRYDKFWREFEALDSESWQSESQELVNRLLAFWDRVLLVEPTSDYEQRDRANLSEQIETAIGRVYRNMRATETLKQVGTLLYKYCNSNYEFKVVDFLRACKDKNTLFDLVKKRVKHINSDHYINIWQRFTEMRYVELGGEL